MQPTRFTRPLEVAAAVFWTVNAGRAIVALLKTRGEGIIMLPFTALFLLVVLVCVGLAVGSLVNRSVLILYLTLVAAAIALLGSAGSAYVSGWASLDAIVALFSGILFTVMVGAARSLGPWACRS